MTEEQLFSHLSQPHDLLLPSLQRQIEIINAAGLGTWEWNVQTGAVIFNRRWAEMAGYSLEELSPLSVDTWVSMVHPEDLARTNTLLDLHFRGLSPVYECECRMRHKNGEWIWILTRGKVLSRTTTGAPLLVCGIHLDITSQKRVIEALQTSEHTYELIALGTPSAMYDWHIASDLVIWRGRAFEVMGVDGNEELPLRSGEFQDWVYPDDRARYRRTLRRYFKRETSVLKDILRLRRRDGRLMWVEYHGAAMWDGKGRAQRMFGSFTNIASTTIDAANSLATSIDKVRQSLSQRDMQDGSG